MSTAPSLNATDPPPQTITLLIVHRGNDGAAQSIEEINVDPSKDLSYLINKIKREDANVISVGKRLLYNSGYDDQVDSSKSLTDCGIADRFCVSVFSSKEGYAAVWKKERKTVQLDTHDSRISGKWDLKLRTQPDKHFEALRPGGDDNDGRALFCAEHVLQLVELCYDQVSVTKGKYLEVRKPDGTKTTKSLGGEKGRQLRALLRVVHYNLDARNRFCSKDREMMQRTLLYEYKDIFTKDKYSEEVRKLVKQLSNAIRVKVGEEWISVPERAFNIVSEVSGRYVGEINFIFNGSGTTVGEFDCGDIWNAINNAGGFTIPTYYRTSMLGMGTRGVEIESVSIETDAKYALIVEDGGVFCCLRQSELFKTVPVVLICTHGHSDMDTRAFVHMLHNKLGLQVLAFTDMNVGGVEVIHTFGAGNGGYSSESDLFCTTKVQWLGLRPSQLGQLKTSGRKGARSLLHNTIKAIASMFDKKKKSRMKKHINGDTTWIANGEEGRRAHRKGEMEELKRLGYGVDVQSAEDDQVIQLILRQLLKIEAGQDNDERNYAYV